MKPQQQAGVPGVAVGFQDPKKSLLMLDANHFINLAQHRNLRFVGRALSTVKYGATNPLRPATLRPALLPFLLLPFL